MQFPLIGPAYRSQSSSADCETLVNLYVERMEAAGARTTATLYRRPGMLLFTTLPESPIRGSLEAVGRFFVAAGAGFYEVFNDGSYYKRGTIENDDLAVSITASPQHVMVVSGGKVYTGAMDGPIIYDVTDLKNTATDYALEWTISSISVIGVTRNIATISEIGTTVTVTFDASAIGSTYRSLLVAGNSITISGVTTAGYNGDFLIVYADISDPTAVILTCTNPTTGLSPDTTGTIEWFYLNPFANPIGVDVEAGDTVIVAGCSHAAFNGTYTVGSVEGYTGGLMVHVLCPLALIADGTVETDGYLITSRNYPRQCGFMDGYFYIWYKDSQYWRISSLFDATVWDAADTARIQVLIDNIVSSVVDHGELWFLCARNSIAYRNSGSEFPFDVIESARIEQGAISTFCPTRMDNSIFWLGKDELGSLVAWRANGYLPQRVSNHAVETEWQSYRTTDDIESFSYQWNGHTFWVIYFPGGDKTWVYDAALGPENGWHREACGDDEDEYTALTARCHSHAFDKHIVGDPSSGNLYVLSQDVFTDNGDPIRWERTAPAIANEQNRLKHKSVQIDMEAGLGSIPDFTGISEISPPTVTTANDDGSLPWGLYSVRLVGIVDGAVDRMSGDASVAIVANERLSVSWSGTISGGNWRVYISSDGWQTGFYFDFGDTGGTNEFQTLDGFTEGLPPNTQPASFTLRWSDDNTRTWSDDHTLTCGNSQEYGKRAIKRRLGTSRKRVYQIFGTDPVPVRLINGYVEVERASRRT